MMMLEATRHSHSSWCDHLLLLLSLTSHWRDRVSLSHGLKLSQKMQRQVLEGEGILAHGI
jgi:hypothetical protein